MQGYTPHSWRLNVANFGFKRYVTPEEAHRNVILSTREPQSAPPPTTTWSLYKSWNLPFDWKSQD